jgi:hypothetical protein
LVLTLAVVSSAGTLAGQDTARVTLVGEVRDYDTEAAVVGASVRLQELDLVRVTDANGFFAFWDVRPGTWTFETTQLGYEPNVEASTIGAGNVLLVRLKARPVPIEGLYVTVVHELERRRLAVPSRVVAWSQRELSEAAPAICLP